MEYSIEVIDTKEESLIEITRFLQESFPKNKKFTLDFVKWQYADNPLGAMLGFNASIHGRIISHFACLPFNMILFGEERRGLLCINVATSAEHRGRKLFTILGEKSIQLAREKGFDFMIAVPNANSSHAFLKYFGFNLISPLTVKVGLGNNIYSKADSLMCCKSWSENQWLWRLSNPANKYAFDNKNMVFSPISFFAKTLSKKMACGKTSTSSIQNIGWRPLNLYIGLGADTSRGLYFNLPSFIKRPPFNLVFKPLKDIIPTLKKEDIFLQLIDLDTI